MTPETKVLIYTGPTNDWATGTVIKELELAHLDEVALGSVGDRIALIDLYIVGVGDPATDSINELLCYDDHPFSITRNLTSLKKDTTFPLWEHCSEDLCEYFRGFAILADHFGLAENDTDLTEPEGGIAYNGTYPNRIFIDAGTTRYIVTCHLAVFHPDYFEFLQLDEKVPLTTHLVSDFDNSDDPIIRAVINSYFNATQVEELEPVAVVGDDDFKVEGV